jgi:DNA-binding MarR family transcriptional regulator
MAVMPEGSVMAAEETTPSRYTGLLIRRAQQTHVAAWVRCVSAEVTSPQFGVLDVLDRMPGASQRVLCDELDLDRSTIALIVARLEHRGLLERRRDAGDKRRNRLLLTAFGDAELARLRPRVAELEAELTAGLSDDDRRELHRLLVLVIAVGGSVEEEE